MNVLIVKIKNDLDSSNSKHILEKINNEIKTKDINKIVLDFSELEFMDSYGIGFIVAIHNAIDSNKYENHRIQIYGAQKYVRTALTLSGANVLCRFVSNITTSKSDIMHYLEIDKE